MKAGVLWYSGRNPSIRTFNGWRGKHHLSHKE